MVISNVKGSGSVASPNSRKCSSAADIVEMVVHSRDPVFGQTLRLAVGQSVRLWHVASPEKISELLSAGHVGIVVLDLAITDGCREWVGELREKFPALIVLVAGDRAAEAALSELISAGIIYRFIHKPLSPGRARLFADAAVRKLAKRSLPRQPPEQDPQSRRSQLAARLFVLTAVIVALVAALWATHGQS